jgi:predicted transcriptional regulator
MSASRVRHGTSLSICRTCVIAGYEGEGTLLRIRSPGSVAEHAFTDGEIEKAVLYRTLRRLEENGYIKSEWDTDAPGPARRVYTLTRHGQEHLEEWAKVLAKVATSMNRFVRNASSGRVRQA